VGQKRERNTQQRGKASFTRTHTSCVTLHPFLYNTHALSLSLSAVFIRHPLIDSDIQTSP
jgi:hypothetical protein